jgi:hypothetical protein
MAMVHIPHLGDRYLAIYLNDHLAGSTTGIELARRIRSENEGTPLGTFMAHLVGEIEADRRALEELMDRLDVAQDKVKIAGAWAGEKIGRLKLNGQLLGYSPLSRLVELEGLSLGVTGKLGLWRALLAHADRDTRLDRVELEHLAERAEEQREGLEAHRLAAAREAFADEANVPAPA